MESWGFMRRRKDERQLANPVFKMAERSLPIKLCLWVIIFLSQLLLLSETETAGTSQHIIVVGCSLYSLRIKELMENAYHENL